MRCYRCGSDPIYRQPEIAPLGKVPALFWTRATLEVKPVLDGTNLTLLEAGPGIHKKYRIHIKRKIWSLSDLNFIIEWDETGTWIEDIFDKEICERAIAELNINKNL
jgi:hypothetical protein